MGPSFDFANYSDVVRLDGSIFAAQLKQAEDHSTGYIGVSEGTPIWVAVRRTHRTATQGLGVLDLRRSARLRTLPSSRPWAPA